MAEKKSPLELDFPEPDYDHLDLAFQDSDDNSTSCCKSSVDDDKLGKKKGAPSVSQYILGTLVVRIVAARDLEVRAKQVESHRKKKRSVYSELVGQPFYHSALPRFFWSPEK
jgi:hypothetical protein